VETVVRVVGPLATNVYLLGDAATGEAIAIDTAIPSLEYVRAELAARGWTLKLIVSTHGHWDHTGDNAALTNHTGAPIAVHPLDAHRLTDPQPLFAPFPIPPSVPAVELAEGGRIRFGAIRLDVLHTPGHTEGSVCLLAVDDGLMLTGDTLFPGGWGRVDLPGGSAEEMVESLGRLARLEDPLGILPGHGPSGRMRDARPWLDDVLRTGRLPG
jgi:glyoxylase-like metal-dependent hydrolase (beta-lactamase superfamily II)